MADVHSNMRTMSLQYRNNIKDMFVSGSTTKAFTLVKGQGRGRRNGKAPEQVEHFPANKFMYEEPESITEHFLRIL